MVDPADKSHSGEAVTYHAQFSDFSGGMNLLVEPSKLNPNEYQLAKNVRNRFANLKPVKRAVELEAPSGLKQGILTTDGYILLFVRGQAFYRYYTSSSFLSVSGFSLSAKAKRVYTAAVPASTVRFRRLLQSTQSAELNVNLDSQVVVNGNPSVIVVQDGVSQPQLIYWDGSKFVARDANTYDQWNTNDREYVPIGLDMVYHNDILFVVSPDRKTLYRSVQGRPLDFVVAVDDTGDKSGNEEDGGAPAVSYSVGYDNITGLVEAGGDAIMISTSEPRSFLITLNTDDTIFGQPTFIRVNLFGEAMVNSFSAREILGDLAFISSDGIRSFNAARELKNESGYSEFSARVQPLFDGLIQVENETCAIRFDQYILFSINTTEGNVVLVYDVLNQSFPSIDTYTGVNVKQFASLIPSARKLYAITNDDKLFEYFAGDSGEGFFRTKIYSSGTPRNEQKLTQLRLLIDSQKTLGTINASVYVDKQKQFTKTATLVAKDTRILYPITYPVSYEGEHNGVNIRMFDLKSERVQGFYVSYGVQWTGGGSLIMGEHKAAAVAPITPMEDRIRTYGN